MDVGERVGSSSRNHSGLSTSAGFQTHAGDDAWRIRTSTAPWTPGSCGLGAMSTGANWPPDGAFQRRQVPEKPPSKNTTTSPSHSRPSPSHPDACLNNGLVQHGCIEPPTKATRSSRLRCAALSVCYRTRKEDGQSHSPGTSADPTDRSPRPSFHHVALLRHPSGFGPRF